MRCLFSVGSVRLHLEPMVPWMLSIADYNSSIEVLFKILRKEYTEDTWKLETTSNLELVCYHSCEISSSPARLEYRITYNEAYAVPKLLFRGSLQDGTPVPLSYFWECFAKNFPQHQNDIWSTISQTEHPITGVPYFFLHPCTTATLMSDINPPTGLAYLTFWLSYIARYFNLFIPESIVQKL